MGKILIKNGRVFDGYEFFDADLLTNGSKIEKIEPNIECDDTATYVFDAAGKIVSAGLVDIHVHLQVSPTDKFGISADLSTIPFGVTAAADAGRTRGERLILDSFTVKNVVFVTAHIRDNNAQLEKVTEATERFGNKVVGLKVYFDTVQSSVTDITPLGEICDYAHARGLRVMVHCSNSPTPMSEILATLGAGDILTHTYHGGVNTSRDDGYESLKAARKRGVVIDAGFAGSIHTDFEIFRKATESGAQPDTLSTDITRFSAYTRGGRYGLTMCMSYSRHLGMSEKDIFRAVTSTAARAVGKEGEWGVLKVGGQADIAVLDYTDEGYSTTDRSGNTIESPEGYRCVLTVSDGQVVFKH